MSRPKAIALYNFDHGFDGPTTFRLGPYEINVSAAQVRTAGKLSRHARIHFTSDGQGRPAILEELPKPGRLAQTARVRVIPPLPEGQPFLGGPPDTDGTGDLCTLLSFMTGRRVLVRDELTGFEGTYHGERVVGRNYFHTVGAHWPNLAAIRQEGLASALWALIQSNSTNDLIGKMCYASAALDSIVTRWFKSQPSEPGAGDSDKVDSARKAIVKAIRAEFGESQMGQDALAGVGRLFTPSAWTKLATYLKAKGYLSSAPAKGEIERAKLLNSVRNRVVHTADVPSELHHDIERRGEIAAAVLAITTTICECHLAATMNLHDFQIDNSQQDVARFFTSGELRGHRVFDEGYASFAARVEREWLCREEL